MKGFNKKLRGYIGRFTILHLLTYLLVGMIFYQLQGYEEALATEEAFKLYRHLEDPRMVAAVFLGQIVRGGILALLLCPFYDTFFNKQRGWIVLFIVLWGLTFLGTGNTIPGLIQDLIEGSLMELILGIPEITTQMLLFSSLIFIWERKHENK